MRAVSNTSPICNLAVIGRLDLLRRRYGRVSITPAVKAELDLLSHAAGKASVMAAIAEGWLVVELVKCFPAPPLPFALDAGESEAILLACQTEADVLLMDERRRRAAARALGLSVGGVLGELLPRKAERLDS